MNVYIPTKLAKSITGNKKGTEFLVSVYPHGLSSTGMALRPGVCSSYATLGRVESLLRSLADWRVRN